MTEKDLIKSLELFSHKLKNPLHAIGINLDVLKSRMKKKLPGEEGMMRHIEIVSTEVDRLQELTLKYLKYLKMKDKERSKIDLRSLLEGKTRG